MATAIQKPGKLRFDHFLQQLETIFINAADAANPGLVLYQQKARNIFFMLEALSRMYTGIHNKKTFEKLDDKFKKLEDMLGQVDYYDGFYNLFATQPNIPAPILEFLQAKRNAWLQELNFFLEKKGWLGKKQKQFAKIKAKLEDANWLDEAEDTAALKNFYANEIASVVKAYAEKKFELNDVEKGVHELRRQLRWLSIYPQATKGVFQLVPTISNTDQLQKYFTAEIVTSPFNSLPPKEGNTTIELSKAHFLALSWMISELGKLKDNGLKVIVLKEALVSLYHNEESQAVALAYPLCGPDQPTLETIIANASSITKTFFDEQVLQNLLAN